MEAGALGRPQFCHQQRTDFERNPLEDQSSMALRVRVKLGGCERALDLIQTIQP